MLDSLGTLNMIGDGKVKIQHRTIPLFHHSYAWDFNKIKAGGRVPSQWHLLNSLQSTPTFCTSHVPFNRMGERPMAFLRSSATAGYVLFLAVFYYLFFPFFLWGLVELILFSFSSSTYQHIILLSKEAGLFIIRV